MTYRMEEGEELIFEVGDRVKTLKFGDGTVRYFGKHKVRRWEKLS